MALTSTTLSPVATSLFPSVWLQANGWNHIPRLIHGFSQRIDDRHLALATLNAETLPLHTLKQVHGDDILIVHQESDTNDRPEADGLMSRESGVLLGIATADCVPVLMVAPEHGLIAALHAGWRGTLKGISQRAVTMLNDRWRIKPASVWVALGPSISLCCYEVGRDVGEALHERWRSQSAWHPHGTGDKGFLDLRAVNRAQCEGVGVPAAQIQSVGPCTFCASPDFASYRREGAGAGRQLSVIGWRKD
ncbi:MAG: peptidoglycan editing factor PgeF [Deltaproteobacteria bacterium]|nr:peptidoglycan editing factor PgeF [Deltaproteobacteria bacterium]